MFPDSSAAKGGPKATPEVGAQTPATTDEQADRQQVLFANLMRGIHW
jgi:hypothetical protein